MTDQTTTKLSIDAFRNLPESNLPHELIDGELIVSPAPKNDHQQVLYRTAKEIDRATGQEPILAPMDVYLDAATVLQPDIFWVAEGGSCVLGDDGYWHGAPDLVVEILSPSTAFRDRGVKFQLYEQHGVREYWLVEPVAEFMEVFVLTEGRLSRVDIVNDDNTMTSMILQSEIDLKRIFSVR